MTQGLPQDNLWTAYCERFPEADPARLRPACHPRLLTHVGKTGKALVLVHGLTDSPAMMLDLARHFHHNLGFDVYLPLLQAHGLREPQGMRGVSLDAWRENVDYAIAAAGGSGETVSIGGLSTGGALALYSGCTDGRITGNVYLFSAALGLADHRIPGLGRFKEMMLRTGLLSLLDTNAGLVGDNPYRYSRVPFRAARELAILMVHIYAYLHRLGTTHPLPKKIFCAWTEADWVVHVGRLRELADYGDGSSFTGFALDKSIGVEHAEVVLRQPVMTVDGKVKERANPRFDEMVTAIDRFVAADS